jgi:signal transduction histidine kinase
MESASGSQDTDGRPLGERDVPFTDCPLGMARVSPDRRLVGVNHALAALWTLRPEKLIGRPCCEALGPAGRIVEGGEWSVERAGADSLDPSSSGALPSTLAPSTSCLDEAGGQGEGKTEERLCAKTGCPVLKCLATGEAQEFERPVGNRVVRAVTWPTWSRGAVSGAILLVTDVTADRAVWQQLFQTQRLAAIGTMTAGVAHELKNPLTTIEGFAQLLSRRRDLPEDAVAQISRLLGEAQRCTRIVSRLLKFARQKDDGKAVLDLNSVVRDSVELMRYQSSASSVQVHESYHPVPLLVVGDGLGLQQVVQSIVRNALDAIAETRRAGNLRVRTCPQDGRVVLELENDGPPLGNPSMLFQPFYTTKRPGEGTGLGLSTSRAIVQGHGGTIAAENTPQGVLFRVSLPAARTQMQAR